MVVSVFDNQQIFSALLEHVTDLVRIVATMFDVYFLSGFVLTEHAHQQDVVS
jgi:hypothetical protein